MQRYDGNEFSLRRQPLQTKHFQVDVISSCGKKATEMNKDKTSEIKDTSPMEVCEAFLEMDSDSESRFLNLFENYVRLENGVEGLSLSSMQPVVHEIGDMSKHIESKIAFDRENNQWKRPNYNSSLEVATGSNYRQIHTVCVRKGVASFEKTESCSKNGFRLDPPKHTDIETTEPHKKKVKGELTCVDQGQQTTYHHGDGCVSSWLPACQRLSGRHGIDVRMKHLSPVVIVDCSESSTEWPSDDDKDVNKRYRESPKDVDEDLKQPDKSNKTPHDSFNGQKKINYFENTTNSGPVNKLELSSLRKLQPVDYYSKPKIRTFKVTILQSYAPAQKLKTDNYCNKFAGELTNEATVNDMTATFNNNNSKPVICGDNSSNFPQLRKLKSVQYFPATEAIVKNAKNCSTSNAISVNKTEVSTASIISKKVTDEGSEISKQELLINLNKGPKNAENDANVQVTPRLRKQEKIAYFPVHQTKKSKSSHISSENITKCQKNLLSEFEKSEGKQKVNDNNLEKTLQEEAEIAIDSGFAIEKKEPDNFELKELGSIPNKESEHEPNIDPVKNTTDYLNRSCNVIKTNNVKVDEINLQLPRLRKIKTIDYFPNIKVKKAKIQLKKSSANASRENQDNFLSAEIHTNVKATGAKQSDCLGPMSDSGLEYQNDENGNTSTIDNANENIRKLLFKVTLDKTYIVDEKSEENDFEHHENKQIVENNKHYTHSLDSVEPPEEMLDDVSDIECHCGDTTHSEDNNTNIGEDADIDKDTCTDNIREEFSDDVNYEEDYDATQLDHEDTNIDNIQEEFSEDINEDNDDYDTTQLDDEGTNIDYIQEELSHLTFDETTITYVRECKFRIVIVSDSDTNADTDTEHQDMQTDDDQIQETAGSSIEEMGYKSSLEPRIARSEFTSTFYSSKHEQSMSDVDSMEHNYQEDKDTDCKNTEKNPILQLSDENNNLRKRQYDINSNLTDSASHVAIDSTHMLSLNASTNNDDTTKDSDLENKEAKSHSVELDAYQKCSSALPQGSVVWGRFSKTRWWPAVVIDGRMVKRPTQSGWIWLYWLSDNQVSQVKESLVEPFISNYVMRSTTNINKSMKIGIVKALQLCAEYANIELPETMDIEDWGSCDTTDGFLHMASNNWTRFLPHSEHPIPDFILEDLDLIQKKHKPPSQLSLFTGISTDDVSKSRGRGRPRKDTVGLSKVAACGEKESGAQLCQTGDVGPGLEVNGSCDFGFRCISCDLCHEVEYKHPLFEGYLCRKCKENLKSSFYAIDVDGCCMFCGICGEGGQLFVCDSLQCGKAFCFECVDRHTSLTTVKLIKDTAHWKCFMCTPYDVVTHSNLKPHADWSLQVVKFFQTGTVPLCDDLNYLSCGRKRKIRVLSLFDGIATGKVALDALGLDIEVYYTSEVSVDAQLVTQYHHQVPQLGDVWDLTREKLEKLCPIDLVLGGPPCNDLSIVNPLRKGFNGTGILLLKFINLVKDIEALCGGTNHVFWLLENTGSMLTEYKQIICKLLGMEPAVWDAKHFTGQRRARNFWGNIPGLYSTPEFCRHLEQDKKDLDSALIANCNRKALVSHTRTITTCSNSLTIRNGTDQGLVTMNGADDHIWIQEIERLFGFPTHYTDVGHLTHERRRKLIGKAWSVPVIKHLLSPLTKYFKVIERDD